MDHLKDVFKEPINLFHLSVLFSFCLDFVIRLDPPNDCKVAVVVLVFNYFLPLPPIESSQQPQFPFLHTSTLCYPTCLVACREMAFSICVLPIQHCLLSHGPNTFLKQKTPTETAWILWPVDCTELRKKLANLKICQRKFSNLYAKIKK